MGKRDGSWNKASLLFFVKLKRSIWVQGKLKYWLICDTWVTNEVDFSRLSFRTWWGTMKNHQLRIGGDTDTKIESTHKYKELFTPLVYEGDIQSCSQISQLAKASPKKSIAMFSLINWTIWVCERKQKNIWEKNMNHVTVCFSPKSPWLTYNLPESWSSRLCNSTGYHIVRSANCFTSSNCFMLLYLHYLFPFPWFLVMFPIAAVWKVAGTVAVSNTCKSQNWVVMDHACLAWGRSFFLYTNLTSNRQPF